MFAPIRDRFRAGAAIAAADYVAALRALDGQRAAWRAATAGYDAVLLPTTANLPPNVERLLADPAHFAAENLLALRNPTLANLLGLCALTLPTGIPGCGLMRWRPGRRRRAAAAPRPRRRAGARLGVQQGLQWRAPYPAVRTRNELAVAERGSTKVAIRADLEDLIG